MSFIRLIIMVVMITTTTISTSAQEECKVLKADIAGEYSGGCKKGLASGQGISKGENIFEGRFKKGLPNGEGTMIYSDGGIYEGKWKNGFRDGEGKYIIQIDGKETVKDGIWKKGKYVGKKKVQGYKIIKKQSVSRYTIRKVGDNFNRVTIKVKNNGQAVGNIQNIVGSLGNRVDYTGYTVYENIGMFPFNCEMRYTVPNKLESYDIRVEFFFQIIEPGDWMVEINH
jgi:hypothetical protein